MNSSSDDRDAGKSGKGKLPLLAAAMLAPILSAYAIMLHFALNVPFIDDYPTVMAFAVKYEALGSWTARMHYILADQYVEYKLVLAHLLNAAQLGLTHHVSVSLLYWIGNLTLLPLLWVLWQTYFVAEPSLERRMALFLPIVLYLFSINYWEALDWASPGLGYLGTIVLSLLTIHLLAKAPFRARAGACGTALLAYAISANSFLLLPIGLYMLFQRRAWRWMAAWCAIFLFSLVPYFIHFSRADNNFGHGPAWWIPVYFLSFLGAGAPMLRLAIPAGVAILAVFALALRWGYLRTHETAVLGAVWLLASAALAAVGRGRTGVEFSTASRYMIFCDLLLVFCYGAVASRILESEWAETTRRRLYWAVLIACFAVWLRGDMVAVRGLRTRRTMLAMGVEHYRQNPQTNSPMFFDVPEHDQFFAITEANARVDTNEAMREGLFQLPDVH